MGTWIDIVVPPFGPGDDSSCKSPPSASARRRMLRSPLPAVAQVGSKPRPLSRICSVSLWCPIPRSMLASAQFACRTILVTPYLLKKTPAARLLEGIREVVAGGSPMSPEVARRVVELFRRVRPSDTADYALTPHETRLLKLIVEGHSYKSAAASLNVSVHTISFHMRSIYEKLQVHSKSEAVSKALRQGLVS